MHSLVNQEQPSTSKHVEKETVVAVATLVTEGRIPGEPTTGQIGSKTKGFYEGPHCQLLKRPASVEGAAEHLCDLETPLCQNHHIRKETVTQLFRRGVPLCIEVFLSCACKEIDREPSKDTVEQVYLLEQWHLCVSTKKDPSTLPFNLNQLANAIRSQLYFSQITAWLVTQAQKKGQKLTNQTITDENIKYRFSTPESLLGSLEFRLTASKHDFPTVDLGNGSLLTVSFLSAPRFSSVPDFNCVDCSFENLEIEDSADNKPDMTESNNKKSVFDDQMPTSCTMKGKHRCEEIEENDCCPGSSKSCGKKRLCQQKPRDNSSEPCSSKSADNNMQLVHELCEASTSKKCEEKKRKISSENRTFMVGFVHELHDPSTSTGCENKRKTSFENLQKEISDNKRKISLDHQRFNLNVHNSSCGTDKSEPKRKISLDHQLFTRELQNFEATTSKCERNRKISLEHKIFTGFGEGESSKITLDNRNDPNKEFGDKTCDTTPSKCGENKRKLSQTENRNSTIGFVHEIPQKELDCCHKNDLNKYKEDKGQILLAAIERSGKKDEQKLSANQSECNNKICDMSECDNIYSIKKFNIYLDKHCDNTTPNQLEPPKIRDISNLDKSKLFKKSGARQRLTFEEDTPKFSNPIVIPTPEITNGSYCDVPSTNDKEKFRKSLGNAANMVFHSRTGLPLTSSPAPVRKGKSRFDFDSSLNSVSAIKSALYSSSLSTDDESENESSIVSPCSPDILAALNQREYPPSTFRRKPRTSGLLGSFVESVLNGRLEPVSTVHGFTADLAASGCTGYVPKHIHAPVTVFFYTFNDNDKVSSPYLGHINLGKKGYQVPKAGTVQVTLFNPLGTVVKMFVVMYDLTDMPPNSQTFIRQRTLHMPNSGREKDLPQWLRYLIHLRFMSSKTGKVYLHSDIRIIVLNKCDLDTATAHSNDPCYDMRSFMQMPEPRYCSRK